MSYDLDFYQKTADQSWADVRDAPYHRPIEPPDPDLCARLLAGTRALLGDVDVFDTDDAYELTHLPTGIQLTYTADGAGISVPYWYTGSRAEEMVRTIYRLGLMVELVTGLAGYDPQLDAPLSEAATRLDVSVGTFDEVIRNLAEYLEAEPPEAVD